MIQSVYTTEDELEFVKGLGIKHKDPLENFSEVQTPRKILLQRYLIANSSRRVDTNHKGHPAIDFAIIFNYIHNEFCNA